MSNSFTSGLYRYLAHRVNPFSRLYSCLNHLIDVMFVSIKWKTVDQNILVYKNDLLNQFLTCRVIMLLYQLNIFTRVFVPLCLTHSLYGLRVSCSATHVGFVFPCNKLTTLKLKYQDLKSSVPKAMITSNTCKIEGLNSSL